MTKAETGLVVVVVVLLAFGFSALVGWGFMALWNGIAVPYFGWPTLTFWAAWGIMFALSIVGRSLGIGQK